MYNDHNYTVTRCLRGQEGRGEKDEVASWLALRWPSRSLRMMKKFFNTVWKRSEWTSASALYVVVDNFVCSSTHV